jgi:transglutaminase-like putative cysteine protease
VLLTVWVAAVMLGACLPLVQAYTGLEAFGTAVGAAAAALGLSWICRRLGAGPFTALALSVAGWALFVGLLFTRSTLLAGLLPSTATLSSVGGLWSAGLELMRTQQTPVPPEPGLVLITVTGVWAVAHAVDELVLRTRAPLQAGALALLLWAVPLALTRGSDGALLWAAPLLAGLAGLLWADARARRPEPAAHVSGVAYASGGSHAHRQAPHRPRRLQLAGVGGGLAALAILAGGLGTGLWPGSPSQPLWDFRGNSGTSLATNPIVELRTNLVADGTRPLLRVSTPRPVYLRTTALNSYDGATERWTNGGFETAPATGRLPAARPVGAAERLSVQVEVENLSGGLLVPIPYQPRSISGSADKNFRYDPGLSTLVPGEGQRLEQGDRYSVNASVPAPEPAALNAVELDDPPRRLTALPESIPVEVEALASRIVTEAGAETAFQSALAIQRELRSWSYSTTPPGGHGPTAMERFLATQTGYCEQFAGTMAVMLRSQGIPARIAVGYTPGEKTGPNEYTITASNAHSWVEVLFPGHGWISFEPTPRGDGNVLVPSAENLSPTRTAAGGGPDGSEGVGTESNPLARGSEFANEAELGPAGRTSEAAALQARGSDESGGTAWRRWLVPGAAAAVLAALAALATLALRARRAGRAGVASSAGEVLAAHHRIRRVGLGLGVKPRASETAAGYLARLAPDSPESEALAGYTMKARYAPALSAHEARQADQAATALRTKLLSERSRARQLVTQLRGALAEWRAEAVTALRARIHRL